MGSDKKGEKPVISLAYRVGILNETTTLLLDNVAVHVLDLLTLKSRPREHKIA